MSMRITSERMTSDQTEHWAVPVDAGQPYGCWWASVLPGRELTRNQAITAITLAEAVAQMQRDGQVHVTHPLWPHVASWAGELDITDVGAVGAVLREQTP
jgi:hypothetical protein